MSIETELTRIVQAKAGLKSSIEGKGVTVPEGTKLDAYPALVSGIPTGVDTSDATAEALDIAKGKTAYARGRKITGMAEIAEPTTVRIINNGITTAFVRFRDQEIEIATAAGAKEISVDVGEMFCITCSDMSIYLDGYQHTVVKHIWEADYEGADYLVVANEPNAMITIYTNG